MKRPAPSSISKRYLEERETEGRRSVPARHRLPSLSWLEQLSHKLFQRGAPVQRQPQTALLVPRDDRRSISGSQLRLVFHAGPSSSGSTVLVCLRPLGTFWWEWCQGSRRCLRPAALDASGRDAPPSACAKWWLQVGDSLFKEGFRTFQVAVVEALGEPGVDPHHVARVHALALLVQQAHKLAVARSSSRLAPTARGERERPFAGGFRPAKAPRSASTSIPRARAMASARRHHELLDQGDAWPISSSASWILPGHCMHYSRTTA